MHALFSAQGAINIIFRKNFPRYEMKEPSEGILMLNQIIPRGTGCYSGLNWNERKSRNLQEGKRQSILMPICADCYLYTPKTDQEGICTINGPVPADREAERCPSRTFRKKT
jgi:hypothetical protein